MVLCDKARILSNTVFSETWGAELGCVFLLMPYCVSDSGAFFKLKAALVFLCGFAASLTFFHFLGRVFRLLMNGFAVF